MKKILLAAICCGMTFFGNVDLVEAEEQQIEMISQSESTEVQELSKWTHFRDKYILDRSPAPPPSRHYPPPPPRREPPPPPQRREPPPPPPGHRPPPPRHYSAQQDLEINQLSAVYNEE